MTFFIISDIIGLKESAQATVKNTNTKEYQMEKSKVYFTSDLSPQSLIKIYEMLGVELKPQVAIKVHSGEKGNQNFLHPDFFKPLIDRIGGTIVE